MTSSLQSIPSGTPKHAPAFLQRFRWLLIATMGASIALTGCETPGQTALAGAAIGAGAGYVAGTAVQNQRNRSYNEGYRDSRYRDNDRRYYNDGRSYNRGTYYNNRSTYRRY